MIRGKLLIWTLLSLVKDRRLSQKKSYRYVKLITMTNFTKLLLITFLLSISFAFTDNADNKIIGTYGVSENDPSQIELIINDDFSFTYHDFSNEKQSIQVYGTWNLKNNAIILHSNQADA